MPDLGHPHSLRHFHTHPGENQSLSPTPAANAAIIATMSSTRGERLRDARKKLFKSARAAALAFAIPVATYSAHERAQTPGGRDYGPEDAQRYARRFGVTAEWLLTGYRQTADAKAETSEHPQGSSTTRLRVIGYVGAGAQVHLYAVATEDLDEIEVPMLAPASTVALEIRGN